MSEVVSTVSDEAIALIDEIRNFASDKLMIGFKSIYPFISQLDLNDLVDYAVFLLETVDDENEGDFTDLRTHITLIHMRSELTLEQENDNIEKVNKLLSDVSTESVEYAKSRCHAG